MKKLIYTILILAAAYLLYKKYYTQDLTLVKNDDPTDPNQIQATQAAIEKLSYATINV